MSGKIVKDERLLDEIRAALMISLAMGAMETIRAHEPAPHTKRHRTVSRAYRALDEVLSLYDRALEYDLVKLAVDLYEGVDERLNTLLRRGLVVTGDVVTAFERWKVNDVLTDDDAQIRIVAVKEEGYEFSPEHGSAVYYSWAVKQDDPYLLNWRKSDG